MSESLEKRLNWGGLRQRYKLSPKHKKHKLLDELCDLTRMNRKYLIRKLNQKSNRKLKKPGPKPTYSPELYLPILKPIWLACDQLCSKKFKEALPMWLPFYEEAHEKLDDTLREKLLQISPATFDRLLKPYAELIEGDVIAALNQAHLSKIKSLLKPINGKKHNQVF